MRNKVAKLLKKYCNDVYGKSWKSYYKWMKRFWKKTRWDERDKEKKKLTRG